MGSGEAVRLRGSALAWKGSRMAPLTPFQPFPNGRRKAASCSTRHHVVSFGTSSPKRRVRAGPVFLIATRRACGTLPSSRGVGMDRLCLRPSGVQGNERTVPAWASLPAAFAPLLSPPTFVLFLSLGKWWADGRFDEIGPKDSGDGNKRRCRKGERGRRGDGNGNGSSATPRGHPRQPNLLSVLLASAGIKTGHSPPSTARKKDPHHQPITDHLSCV